MRRCGPQHTSRTGHDSFDELVARQLHCPFAAGRNDACLAKLRDERVIVSKPDGGPVAGLERPGTPVYRKWHEACLKQLDGRTPKYGALWAAYYPGLTFEWYPNVLVVSHLIPRSPTHTTNVVEFYYPEEIVLFEREFIEAQQAAYVETALEDYEICQRLDRGCRALFEQGLDDAGPYQSPMEDAEVHFHEWLHQRLGP